VDPVWNEDAAKEYRQLINEPESEVRAYLEHWNSERDRHDTWTTSVAHTAQANTCFWPLSPRWRATYRQARPCGCASKAAETTVLSQLPQFCFSGSLLAPFSRQLRDIHLCPSLSGIRWPKESWSDDLQATHCSLRKTIEISAS
jgi:hypothetical protein